MKVTPDDRRVRRPGWEKLNFGAGEFVNQDLHDQQDCWAKLVESGLFNREPITLLFPAESTSQERRLYAATRSRVYVQSGNQWRIVVRGLGGTTAQSRFQAAQLANTIVFSNGVDRPLKHTFGTASDPCNWVASAYPIDQLNKATPNGVGLTRAKLVRSFNGSVFLMNTVEGGVRYPSRIRFSGFNNPDRWLAGNDTVAGFQDLPYDESITGAAELLNTLIVFTNKSMYRCQFDGASYSFERIYSERRGGSGLLAYPNSLISDGNTLWWMGQDAVYKYNIFVSGPVRDETLHLATKAMYDQVDSSCCDQVVAGFDPEAKEIWWSYPEQGSGCSNSRTLVYNVAADAADYVDHGFTSFANFIPDNRQTLGQWMTEFCGGGDLNSLCESLGSRVVDDFCQECDTRKTFIGASSEDYCLKDIGTAFYREQCSNPSGEGSFNQDGSYAPSPGSYDNEGYTSIARGVFPFGKSNREKVIRHILADVRAVPSVGESNYLRLRVGTSYGALDPNPGGNLDAVGYDSDTNLPAGLRVSGDLCEVIWRNTQDKPLSCPETSTNTASLQGNVRPNLGIEWPVFEEGRFLFFELSILGRQGSQYVLPVGGESQFNRLEVQSRPKPEDSR